MKWNKVKKSKEVWDKKMRLRNKKKDINESPAKSKMFKTLFVNEKPEYVSSQLDIHQTPCYRLDK